MQTINHCFMGIELGNARKGFTCAILDSGKRIQFLGMLSPLEWQAQLNGYQRVLAAINSPLTLNDGFMSDDQYRQQLKPVPPQKRYYEMRVCEYELVSRGLPSTRTPRNVGKFSLSLQKALKWSSELGVNGFDFWPEPNSPRQMLETQSDAVFWSLTGVKPFSGSSLEGRIQRQLALQSKGVEVPDAMIFFEEVTRHRLLTGKLPDEMIKKPSELNALAAAYTAWVVGNRPAEHTRIGEPDEGVIILPTATLPEIKIG